LKAPRRQAGCAPATAVPQPWYCRRWPCRNRLALATHSFFFFARARFSQNLERKQPLIILSRAASDQRLLRERPERAAIRSTRSLGHRAFAAPGCKRSAAAPAIPPGAAAGR